MLRFSLLLFVCASLAPARTIDFNRDVRPILSDKCFHCHGPDAKNQKSNFRLDSQENILKAVTPGKLRDSELHHRIHAEDLDDVMPPPDSNRRLSAEQKATLDAWIEQGAPYAKHWAFERPRRPTVPEGYANPIDAFVRERLKAEGLAPNPPAASETLLRRAALVTSGLLPSEPAADYAAQLDELLSSQAYAERQALYWLDAARYADTDGYQNDAGRSNWPWRDWVIHAFQQNMPFDQFTIEQLAGDMLPEATPLQVLASAFNRNHRQNSEGGALAEEFFVENVIDRVETTSTVFLGLTMGCARCHDHKYDPLSQREFYQLYAYFNNIGERGTGKGVSANPILKTGSPIGNTVPEALPEKLTAAEAALAESKAGLAERQLSWEASLLNGKQQQTWLAPSSIKVSTDVGRLVASDDSWLADGQQGKPATYRITLTSERAVTAIRLEALPHKSFTAPNKLARSVNGNFVLNEVSLALDGKPVRFSAVKATYSQANYPAANLIDGKLGTGWAISGIKGPASALFTLANPLRSDKPLTLTLIHASRFAEHNIGRFRISISDTPAPTLADDPFPPAVLAAAQVPADQRDGKQNKLLSTHYASVDVSLRQTQKAVDDLRAEIAKQGYGVVPVMVMQEREGEPMTAYFLKRGQYTEPDMDQPMSRRLPEALYGTGEPPKDRLELARWLVSRDNPLTARVIVNRLWQQIFGIGLVKTVEDFGSQGEMPSHPELLDWLAVEFIESGWDYRALFRLILESETFRQSSASSAEQRLRDPQNRLLARGPRYRLDGFAIRDNALRAAGLLNPRIGGPPVKPYQPTGLWNTVAGGSNIRYGQGKGADLYRKSLYTYWKRAVNPPRQIIFDAAGRETCNVNARITNTPLQALVLMNDVTFVEAARNLAQRVMTSGSSDSRLQRIYQQATARQASEATLAVLRDNFAFFQSHFAADSAAAEAFLKAGESPRDAGLQAPEHAAYTAVAHLVLNLDETITLE
jgi:hypothetical protein